MAVLASREGGKVSFRLHEGAGERVPRAPWRIEWGGGASVENPHFQRVHYCQLLARPRPSRASAPLVQAKVSSRHPTRNHGLPGPGKAAQCCSSRMLHAPVYFIHC